MQRPSGRSQKAPQLLPPKTAPDSTIAATIMIPDDSDKGIEAILKTVKTYILDLLSIRNYKILFKALLFFNLSRVIL
jgi:hypothetical protein